MAVIRIEAVEDPKSGLYFVEIYNPADSERPFVTTAPRYRSAAAAETDTIAILAAAANNARPENRDPG
ncbi:MAG TPA: hypothetical protein VM434_15900 [Beijerinckiaceae bacterium]|nr:hypothetical protein [Beijerinckiaceae bacterium]